jgi:hypothetical protein
MAVFLSPIGNGTQFLSLGGLPLTLGTLSSFAAGTTTPQATYTTNAGTIANPLAITLGVDGRPPNEIWLTSGVSYKFVLKDVLGNLIASGTYDNITGINDVAGSGAIPASAIGYGGSTLDTILLSSSDKVVTSIAAMKAIDKTKYTEAFVMGYYATGDGGGGAYYYDPTDTTTADNGGTVIVATDGGRWKLQFKDAVYVEQFGAQQSTSIDCTAYVQAAVNAVSTVRFHAANYLVAGSVTVPYGVKLIGESKHGTIRPNPSQVILGAGTIIYVTSTTLSPFIYYSGQSFIGLTVYYPNQLRTLSTPIIYPPTFAPNPASSTEVLTNNIWQDCQSVNAYRFISVLVGHLDFEFSGIEGCVLYRGIETDGCGGTDFFRNIRFSYYYFCQGGDAAAIYILANAIGISVGRSDAFHMDRVYVGSMNIGIRFFKGAVNTLSGPYGSINGLSLDSNNYGVYSESTHPIGVNITDMMSNNALQDIEIPVASPDPSVIQVTGFKLWGTKTDGVRVNKVGCSLKLSSGEMYSFTHAGVSVGYSGGDIMIDAVKFANAGTAPPLIVAATQNSLVFTNNFCNVFPTLTNVATYTQISNNANYNDIVKTIASIATIDLSGAGDNLKVSGTTTVTGLSGGWTGRSVRLMSTTGSINYGLGVNILGNKTVSQGEALTFTYDGTNWWPSR